jgi:hypothetical protein
LSDEPKEQKGLLGSKLMLIPALLAIYLIVLYMIRPFELEGLASRIVSIDSIILALVGALAFVVVSHRFGWFSTKSGQISVLITIGLVLWTIAETIWFLLEEIGVNPFPSPADFFYIVGYIPFAIALLLNIRTIHVKFRTTTLALWIVLSAAILVSILAMYALQIGAGLVTIEDIGIIGAVYPLEDFLIIVLALVIVLKFRAGEVAKAWGLLVAGFILEAAGDILFWYEENLEFYQTTGPYDIVDLIFGLGYVAIIASGLALISTFGARGGRKSA